MFSAKPSEIFNAWLDSQMHSEMTGGEAKCSPLENDTFSAWDGYISGKNLKLIENKEIIQSWRTSDFKEADPDSEVIIKLQQINTGTEMTLTHNNIPSDSESNYEQGWQEHYFAPMTKYFG